LALFGRRPSVRADSFVIPASENLHKLGHRAMLSSQHLFGCAK
jgi:hypothetical protein